VIPTFVFWLCGASGILIIALALPLWLRRVPPNVLYGARFAGTLATPEVWYLVNARAGRELALIGAVYLIAICALAANPVWRGPVPLLFVTGGLIVSLVSNTIRLSRFATRLARETKNGAR
jgi:hypothetical protein